jgi:hypothetical protein
MTRDAGICPDALLDIPINRRLFSIPHYARLQCRSTKREFSRRVADSNVVLETRKI